MAKQKYSTEQHKQIIAIFKEKDDVKRWRLIHDLLRETNPKAKREQDRQAKALKKVREEGLYNNKEVRGAAGLRFSVSIPNTTYQALVEMDIATRGKSSLRNPEKQKYETRNATNKIAQKLSRAFPEYRVS